MAKIFLAYSMPQILTINNQKGGTSKTVLSLNLCYALSRRGKRVAAVDSDPQGSLTKLIPVLEDGPLIIPRSKIETWSDLRSVEDADYIIIDTMPYLSVDLAEIFAVSDLVLMPVRSSLLDVMALNDTLSRVRKAQEDRSAIMAAVVLVQSIHGTSYNQDGREAAEATGLPVLATEMKMRVGYARSVAEKAGIFSSGDEKAISEFEAITTELLNLLKVRQNGKAE